MCHTPRPEALIVMIVVDSLLLLLQECQWEGAREEATHWLAGGIIAANNSIAASRTVLNGVVTIQVTRALTNSTLYRKPFGRTCLVESGQCMAYDRGIFTGSATSPARPGDSTASMACLGSESSWLVPHRGQEAFIMLLEVGGYC